MPSCEPLWPAAAACGESRQRRERAAATGGSGRKGWRGKSGFVFPIRFLVVLRQCADPRQFAGFLSCRNSTKLSSGRLQLLFGVACVWRHAPCTPWLRRHAPMGSPTASCPSLARTSPPPPPGPLSMSRALVGGRTDADTLGHTPHERTHRLRVIPPSVLAHAEETGLTHGSTVPPGRGVHRAPFHTPAAP